MNPRALVLGVLVCVVAIQSVSSGQAPVPPVGASRVSGRVTTSAREPIEGATLALALIGERDLVAAVWTTTSDADGNYSFSNVPVGRFAIVVSKEGYAYADSRPRAFIGRPLSSSIRGPTGPRRVFELPVGVQAADFDFVLQRPGTISGQVFALDGSPAAKARVVALVVEDGIVARVGAGAITDAGGRFVITDAPPGSIQVGVPASAFLVEIGGVATGVVPQTMVPINVLEGGIVSGIEIRAAAPQGFWLSGRITDERGSIPRNLRIEFGNPNANHRTLERTRADGTFTFKDDNIEPGPVSVFALGETDDGPVIGLTTFLAIEGLNDVTIAVGKGGTINGRVVLEGGAILAAFAPQIALARVGFTPLLSDDPVLEVASDGWFEATSLLGEYRVEVRRPEGWVVKSVRRRGASLAGNRLALANGQLIDGLEIAIGPR